MAMGKKKSALTMMRGGGSDTLRGDGRPCVAVWRRKKNAKKKTKKKSKK
jgi:hypothetical protein